jgi:hypothetical protein
VAVLRLHAASASHVTKAAYSCMREDYVRWGTKCRKLRTPCLKWSMFCTSPRQSERVPPPSLLARRSTSGASIAPIQEDQNRRRGGHSPIGS